MPRGGFVGRFQEWHGGLTIEHLSIDERFLNAKE